MSQFVHLHVHTQFSLLDGASNIADLFSRAKALKMPALAITDHGNMFGVLHFIKEATKQKIKPIIGCEVYVAEGDRFTKGSREHRSGNHLILLAKNKAGYHNLSKIVSKGFIEGFYYTPRIDKELLRQYSAGLIATSACLAGEVPQAIMRKGFDGGLEVALEFRDIFGDDFYLELQNHGREEQLSVNPVIAAISAETGIKMVATNDVHFINADDYEAHKILICLNTSKDIDDPSALMYTGEEYLKSGDEMLALFPEYPEAIANTLEIAGKIETYSLEHEVVLPVFPLPEGFSDADEYLSHLTYEGARRRYDQIDDLVSERIEYELSVIKRMGYAGYFLIVQDFIAEARRRGTLVGPGRGSAAGSAVAYCVGITNIDPIKYRLLFERFLNPERMSMPDIDVDFDDYGRDDIIRYVQEKYGVEKVAQIITYGTMAAKSAIRDVARVLKLPLSEADKLAKLVPAGPNVSLEVAFKKSPELKGELEDGEDLVKNTLKFARTLEGSVRQTGTHACGVIIGPDDLTEHIPLCTQRDSDVLVTQYDGRNIESVGMLKMDFLGLKTLSIIKDALIAIRERHRVDIVIDDIPLDDEKTFQLFQRGDTIGVFQFESEGMQMYLKELEPESIEDLIAMNALYRPGPMDYIPVYINRKKKKVAVEYPHEMLKGILEYTYGIMVYQEQIMQTAQIMGGFTLGSADILRKAMGKKDSATMMKQQEIFVKGAMVNGVDSQKATEVFDTMKKFAEYGFNRSHSAAYSVLAYQTAYLKAHYPAEFMASVLAHSLHDIKEITFLIDSCKQNGITVLGPDINKSGIRFSTTEKGEIVFGLGAIKGVGEAAAEAVIKERKENGEFISVFDLVKRVNLRAVNRKSIESMAVAGVFDSLNTHRAQFFYTEGSDGVTFLEKLVKFGQMAQQRTQSAQWSLFGEDPALAIPDPEMPVCELWPRLLQLNKEKEIIGFYVSGHPLDQYRLEIELMVKNSTEDLKNNIKHFHGREFTIGAMVNEFVQRATKGGGEFGQIIVEDFKGTLQLTLFGDDYKRFKHLMSKGEFIFVRGKVIRRQYGAEEFQPRVTEIIPLSEILNLSVKRLTLYMNPTKIELNGQTGVDLKRLIKESPGNCKLKITINDGEDAMSFIVPKKQVNPAEFLRDLKSISGIPFTIEV